MIQVGDWKSNILPYNEAFLKYTLLDIENITNITLIVLTLKLDIILNIKNKMLAYLIPVVFYLAGATLQKYNFLPMLEQVS